MVTLKHLPELQAFSVVSPDGRLVENAITRAFAAIIRDFHLNWRSCEEISPFAIMPDHIHLLIKIRDIPERQSLGRLVYPLRRALSEAYWRVVGAGETAPCKTFLPKPSSNHSPLNDSPAGLASGGFARPKAPPPPIFAPDWHDWIVKRKGQLAAFGRYIRENPERAALRRANARFFRQVAPVDFLGRRWFAYGNRALLDLPAPIPLKGHRATKPGTPDWNALLATAARIRPGGAGVSTFMSPLEKACGNAIARAGGAWIILSPEGFSPRWHPPREKERFCARGRMLYLSLYEARTRQPTRAELYHRCHEMVDLAIAGLAKPRR